MSQAYITHTDAVLNPGKPTTDFTHLSGGLQNILNGLTGSGESGGKEKKRKRAHDPNAPKRALTPFFLFMQHKRPEIAKQLGGNTRPKDVSEEGTRRWQSMNEKEKEVRAIRCPCFVCYEPR